MDHRPPDRGRPYRHDPPHQAWRQGLDQRLPDKPVTEKPAETRMGSGKGNPERWVAVVKPGRIMFELGVPRPGGRPRGHRAGHPEAAHQGQVRAPGRRSSDGEVTDSSATSTTTSSTSGSPRPREELFNLRFQPCTGQLENARRAAGHAARGRPHPHRAARAARSPRPRRGDRRRARWPRTTPRPSTRAQPPQGPRGHRHVQRHGQDRHRHRHRPRAATGATARRCSVHQALRPRRGQRPQGRRPRPGARRPARCRSSSAGGSSRSLERAR